MPSQRSAELTVASFNLHAGVRRDGTPFDVAGALASLDADVIVVQEAWWPDEDPHPLAGIAPAGFTVQWAAAGTGHLRAQGEREDRGMLGASAVRMERVGGRRPVTVPPGPGPGSGTGPGPGPRPGEQVARGARPAPGQRGEIGTAVLCRLPVTDGRVVPLELLPRDHAARTVLLQAVRVGDVEVEVAGIHMAHLSQGSLRHFAAVRALLGGDAGRARLLLGDMNLWGTVVERVLPGWRRAVRGRSWPAPLPVAQPDHVLVQGPLTVVEGRVLGAMGSDHRPVRAVVRLGPS